MPRGAPRSRHLAIASLIVAGTLTLAANVAAGLESGLPTPIPDSAFGPVALPSHARDAGPLKAAREERAEAAPTDDLSPVRDTILPTPPPDRPQPVTAATKPLVRVIPPPPPPAPKTTRKISGLASWYCRAGSSPCTYGYPDGGGIDAYAAAGPRLRAAIGSAWRGKIVYVDGLRVKLVDWCQCYQGQANEKLLDLYYDVYARVGGSVTVRW